MAEKTSEMAGSDPEAKAAALEAKLDAIREMRRIALATDACIREDILQYFGEVSSPVRKSISVRVVEWLFSRAGRRQRTRFCCDRCDGINVKAPDQVVDWASRVFAEAR
jgi:hypothetical protein